MSNAASRIRKILKSQKAAAISVASPSKKPVNSAKPISIKEIAEEPNLEDVVKKINQAASGSVKFRNRHNIYDFTISRLALNKRYNLIEDIVESHKKLEDITHEGFALRLMSFYTKAGMFDNARKLFDELPELGCPTTVKLFNALLKAAVESKRFDEVSHLYVEIPPTLSISLDVVSYNTIINALCEKGSLDEAVSMLDVMKENDVSPSVVTFNTLLDAFYREKGFERGEKIWGVMDDYNVTRNTRSYNLKMQGLINEGELKKALDLFGTLESKGLMPDVNSFNVFIREYSDQGNVEEAKKYYIALLDSGGTPNSITFSALVPKLCDNGEFAMAFELCKKMFKRQFVVDEALLQLVVDGLVNVSMIEEAKELVELGKSNVYVHYDLVLPSEFTEKEEAKEHIDSL